MNIVRYVKVPQQSDTKKVCEYNIALEPFSS